MGATVRADHGGLGCIDPHASKLFVPLNPEAFGGTELLTHRVADIGLLL